MNSSKAESYGRISDRSKNWRNTHTPFVEISLKNSQEDNARMMPKKQANGKAFFSGDASDNHDGEKMERDDSFLSGSRLSQHSIHSRLSHQSQVSRFSKERLSRNEGTNYATAGEVEMEPTNAKSFNSNLDERQMEQMKKFSNRYMFESRNCERYDLQGQYFNKENPLVATIRTPEHLTTKYNTKPEPPKKRTTLVKNIASNSKKNQIPETFVEKPILIGQQCNVPNNITCKIDGTPWQPKWSLDRSEMSWYRKHFHTTEAPVPQPKVRYDAFSKILRPQQGLCFFK